MTLKISPIITTLFAIFLILTFVPGNLYGWGCMQIGWNKLPRQEIDRIIKEHEEWLKSDGTTGKRADLIGCDFTGSFQYSDLDLRKAELGCTNMSGINLPDTDLSGADMRSADLSRTNLFDVNFVNTNLSDVNFDKARFDVPPDKIPSPLNLWGAYNFYSMTYIFSPAGLYALRRAFREHGFRQQEREITYAIMHNERLKNQGTIEKTMNLILFELSCEWGMNPVKPIIILLLSIPLFSFCYFLIILFPRKNGIWLVWNPNRIRKDLGSDNPVSASMKVYILRRFEITNLSA